MNNLNERIAELQLTVNACSEKLQAEAVIAARIGSLYAELRDERYNRDELTRTFSSYELDVLAPKLGAAGITLENRWREYSRSEIIAIVRAARLFVHGVRRQLQRELSDAAHERRSLCRLLARGRQYGHISTGGGCSCRPGSFCTHSFSMRGASLHAQKRRETKDAKKVAKKAAKYHY